MVVDDDADLLRLLSIRLQGAGYGVTAVESGEAALSQLAVASPDVVITDLRMDGMDGMALFESLQKKNAALPVIILTAHGTNPDAVDATQRGVFGYITKPFDGKALLTQVQKALQFGGSRAAANDGSSEGSWRDDIITRSPASRRTTPRIVHQTRPCRSAENTTGPNTASARLSGYFRVDGAQLCRISRGAAGR